MTSPTPMTDEEWSRYAKCSFLCGQLLGILTTIKLGLKENPKLQAYLGERLDEVQPMVQEIFYQPWKSPHTTENTQS